MKVLKWIRYGFLFLGVFSLGTIPIQAIIRIFDLDDYSQYFFIIYAVLSIIELCKSENKFEPKIMYYCGAAMSTIILFSSRPFTMIRDLLERYFSHVTTETILNTMLWIYHILAVLLLLIGAIWEIIRECKRLRNDNKKIYHLSKIFSVSGFMFLLVAVLKIHFGLSELINYSHSFYREYVVVSWAVVIIFYLASIGLIIASIVLKIIHIVESKKVNSEITENVPSKLVDKE